VGHARGKLANRRHLVGLDKALLRLAQVEVGGGEFGGAFGNPLINASSLLRSATSPSRRRTAPMRAVLPGSRPCPASASKASAGVAPAWIARSWRAMPWSVSRI